MIQNSEQLDLDVIADEEEPIMPEPANDVVAAQLSPQDYKAGVEAVIFAASSPLSVKQIEEMLKIPADDLASILTDLQSDYANRGVNLVERSGRWLFQTSEHLSPYLTFFRTRPAKLSRAAMETLAVVAYHQPVTRTEIENIRGVTIHRGTLDILLETGWVKPGKRREVPGRPLTWVTTDVFLQHFGLVTLKELPGVEELKSSGLLDKRPAIAIVPSDDDMDETESQGGSSDDEDLSDFLSEDEAENA